MLCLNLQITRSDMRPHKVGSQTGDCTWSLYSSSGVCVCMYGLTYSLYRPWGCLTMEKDASQRRMHITRILHHCTLYTLGDSPWTYSSLHDVSGLFRYIYIQEGTKKYSLLLFSFRSFKTTDWILRKLCPYSVFISRGQVAKIAAYSHCFRPLFWSNL